MATLSRRIARVEARSAQLTVEAFAARAAPVVGIDAGELAVELAQVLAECRGWSPTRRRCAIWPIRAGGRPRSSMPGPRRCDGRWREGTWKHSWQH